MKQIGRLPTDLAAAQLGLPATERCAAAAQRLTMLLTGADPLVVRDVFVSSLGTLQLASVPYFAGVVAAELDPVAKQRGSLNIVQALMLVRVRVLATMLPGCRAKLVVAGRAWLDAPVNRPVDIWPERQPPAQSPSRCGMPATTQYCFPGRSRTIQSPIPAWARAFEEKAAPPPLVC